MTRADFFAALHTIAPGTTLEAMRGWIDFAANNLPSAFFPSESKEARMEKLLDAIYADMCAVCAACGTEITKEVIDFSLYACCIYPGEIRVAGKCLYNGGNLVMAYDGLAFGDIEAENPLFLVSLHPLTERDCGPDILIREREVPCGMWDQRMEPGYILWNGTVLLESERDDSGCCRAGGGAG